MTEICNLVGKARQPLPEHVAVIGRAVAKLASGNFSAELEASAVSWVSEVAFKKCSATSFFKPLVSIEWSKIACACKRAFVYREMMSVITEKQLSFSQVQAIAEGAAAVGLHAEGAKLLIRKWVRGESLPVAFEAWVKTEGKDEKIRKNLLALASGGSQRKKQKLDV